MTEDSSLFVQAGPAKKQGLDLSEVVEKTVFSMKLKEYEKQETPDDHPYWFWEDCPSPLTDELYFDTITVYTRFLDIPFDRFVSDYDSLGKKTLYLGSIYSSLREGLKDDEIRGFMGRLYPEVRYWQGVYNAFETLGGWSERIFEDFVSHFDAEESDIDIKNRSLRYLNSPFITNKKSFLNRVVSLARKHLPRGSLVGIFPGQRNFSDSQMRDLDNAISSLRQCLIKSKNIISFNFMGSY